MHDVAVIDTVRRRAVPVDLESAAPRLLAPIDPHISLVLIGEATHGTLEFYRIRADLPRTLIRQGGFNVVQADWPDQRFVPPRGRAARWTRAGELTEEQMPIETRLRDRPLLPDS